MAGRINGLAGLAGEKGRGGACKWTYGGVGRSRAGVKAADLETTYRHSMLIKYGNIDTHTSIRSHRLHFFSETGVTVVQKHFLLLRALYMKLREA